MPLIGKPFGLTSGVAADAAYTIDNSCMLDGTADYLTFTPSGTSTTRTKWTISIWFKTCAKLSDGETIIWAGDSGNDYERIRLGDYNSSGYGAIIYDFGVGGVTQSNYTTDRLLRDPSAWYHLVASRDGATISMYLNGVAITSWNTSSAPDASDDGFFGHTVAQRLGRTNYTNADFFNGYQAEAILILETIYTASDFGEFNSDGVWIPVDPSALTFGTNGFWLDFEDSSDLGKDVSGNANDFTSVSMSASNQTLDSPTDSGTTIGNYCVINPVDSTDANSLVLANGNLEYAYNSAMKENACTIVIPAGTGTWRWEWNPDAPSDSYDPFVGIITKSGWLERTADASPQNRINAYAWSMNVQASNGIRKVHDNSFESTSLGTYTTGDIIGFFLDSDNGELFANNEGGTPESLYSGLQTTEGWYILVSNGAGSTAGQTPSVNFGQTAYAFSAPSGYEDYINVLTSNLPAPTITKPTDQFLPILYEGNGAGQRVGNFIPFTDTFAVGASCRFDEPDSDSLTYTPGGAGDTKVGTFSCWMKIGEDAVSINDFVAVFAAGPSATYRTQIGIDNNTNALEFAHVENNVVLTQITTDRSFSFTDTWFNLVVSWDMDDSTASTRIRLYVNGVELTNFSTDTREAAGSTLYFGSTDVHAISQRGAYADNFFDGYMAEVCWVDGTQLTPSSFGETDTSTNRWIPKDPSGLTFGTTGFYLAFASGNDLGDDTSGNGNDFTENNIDTTNGSNQMYDTPSQNFCTWNPEWKDSEAVLTEGNLKAVGESTGSPDRIDSTMFFPSTGKYYYEARVDAVDGTYPATGGGIFSSNFNTHPSQAGLGGFVILNNTTAKVYVFNHVETASYTGTTLAAGDVIGVAINMDTGKFWFSYNGTFLGSGDPEAGTNESGSIPAGMSTVMPSLSGYNGAGVTGNFGQWRYFDGATTTLDSDAGGYFQSTSVPSGFKALQQDNLPANTAGITGLSWIKNRDAADPHVFQNRISGIYEYLEPNDQTALTTNTNSVQRFLQQGVQIGNMDAVNTSAESFVLWQWANDGSEVTNTDGSISGDSTVRANTTVGFSMVRWSGSGSADTIGHGLGATPSLIIVKNTASASHSWYVYHTSTGNTGATFLNLSSAFAPSSTYWNDTSPTSTVFTVGSNAGTNGTTAADNQYAFCWAAVEGYSSFGSYVGNQDNDGPYVFVGFAPTWVMIKESDAAGSNWHIWDNKRRTYNPNTLDLNADLPNAEGYNNADIDLLGSGFKIRTVGTGTNEDGKTYIYAAFAENPFGGSGVAQARAR